MAAGRLTMSVVAVGPRPPSPLFEGSMYAVIETGGKQYRVEVGTELEVELLDVEPGKTITLDRVLLVADGDESAIGTPLVDGAAVSAEVVRHDRGDEADLVQVPPQGPQPGQEGPSPGADGPAHHRHHASAARAPRTTSSKADADAKTERQRLEEAAATQAAEDAALAAKLDGGRPRRRPRKTRRQGDAADEGPEPAKAEADARRPRPTAEPRQPPSQDGRRGRDRRRDEPPRGGARRSALRAHEEGRVDRWPTRKRAAASKNGRDSVGQRLGVKAGDGQLVTAGSIIVRQRGMTFLAGDGRRARPRLHRLRHRSTGKVKFEHATKDKKRIRVEARSRPSRSPTEA